MSEEESSKVYTTGPEELPQVMIICREKLNISIRSFTIMVTLTNLWQIQLDHLIARIQQDGSQSEDKGRHTIF